MSAHDSLTLDFYVAEAAAYADRERTIDQPRIDVFAGQLPAGAIILELGCGGGHDSAAFIEKGFDVDPTDGCPAVAREAEKRLNRPVRVLLFEDLDEFERYDGVWANASLLHVPRSELRSVIERVRTALKPDGIFHASFKAGSEEGRDRFGRYYNYPTAGWLRQAYHADLWQSFNIERTMGSGYDGEPTEWLLVTAKK